MTDLLYFPHAAQAEVHRASDVRFRTVCTGRRFGKTLCMAAELLDRGAAEGGGDYGWVAPTYNVAERGIEAFQAIASGVVRVVKRMPARVDFNLGAGPSRVWFLSADNPDSMRGFGFKGIVVDEAASVPVDVWNYVLRPTLAQTLGWGVFIGTPAGRNWFYDMFTRGVEGQTGFKSFTFPSNVSPYFPEKEWEEARSALPEDVFRQEYMAEFLEDSSGVFRGVDGCLFRETAAEADELFGASRHTADTPQKSKSALAAVSRPANGFKGCVVVGCDIAKHTDWTVCIAMDARSGRCLEMERFNQLDWPVQRDRIAAFVKRWNGRLVMDATGVGDPIYDDLRRVLSQVEPFKFTAQSKRELVQGLMVAVEQRRVMWPAGQGSSKVLKCGSSKVGGEGRTLNVEGPTPNADGGSGNWEVLTAEMKRFEYQLGSYGQVSYGAPSGYHDDCVMALALAVFGAARPEPGRMFQFSPGGRFGRRERVLTMV